MFERAWMLRDGARIEVREASSADALQVLEYMERVSGETDFLTFGPGELGFGEEEERRILSQFAASAYQLFLLAWVDGELAGSLSFVARARPRVWHVGEFGMSVARAHWGRGVGSGLLDSLLGWAREHGTLTRLTLQVRTDNHRAIALYESRGFVREASLRRQMRVAGIDYDNHWMALDL